MTQIHIAANNAEIGGGEVMLIQIAEAVRALGHEVHIIGPGAEDGVVRAAAARGFQTTALDTGRQAYMRALASWDRDRNGVLWCNGLVPALATVGRPDRIVHLHQAPSWRHVAAGRLASLRSLALLVPSRSMADLFPTAQILPNWVPEVHAVSHPVAAASRKEPIVLGFLGRLSPDKGVHVLAQAVRLLDSDAPGRYRLLLAGTPRFVDNAAQRMLDASLAPIAHLTEHAGWIDRAEFFSAVDLAVFPSVWDEPFGLIVAEAMSARVPFVISDAGALPEVAGTEYPWVARKGSADALARVIKQALAAPVPGLRQQVDQLYDRWKTSFSPYSGQERVRHLLSDVLPQE